MALLVGVNLQAVLVAESDANIATAPFPFQVADRVDQKALPDGMIIMVMIIMIMIMIMMRMMMMMMMMVYDWILPFLWAV